MRLSTDETDADAYQALCNIQMRGKIPRIYLDGVEIKNCITADDEKGEALAYKQRPDGTFVIDASGENVEVEVLRGKVEIKITDRPHG